MFFGSKLDQEVYPPWKDYYMNYNNLRKLLKEGVILKDSWTDKDEQNFVSALDHDLEKVYTFQTKQYDELSETLDALQTKTETPGKFDTAQFLTKLEETLELAQELDRFQRLNYTGFTKIVKKHDRIHPEFLVKPLLNVRLKNLPFHSEDYLPLLYKISALFQFLRDNYNIDQTLSNLSLLNEDTTQDVKSFKFWIHRDNLMEVKATILRHLPVLVYNNDNYEDDDDDDDALSNDPVINTLYFDNPNFDLYNDKLIKKANAATLRIKWIGKLLDNPKISVEKKSFDPTSDTFDVNEKVVLKEKYLDTFVKGNFSPEKLIKKMEKRGENSKDFADTVQNLESFITEHHLQPAVRSVYRRTAFQIPGDDKIRVVIDSDLMFIREDSFDEQRPIRDPKKWHRTDIDSKILNPYSLLRSGEYSKFPYSVMEIKIKTSKNNKRLLWVDELVHSHLVKEVPNFSKFVHGVSVLFLEDDKLQNIPMWYHDLETDIKVDPQQAYIDSRRRSVKQQNDEDNLAKFKLMVASSSLFSPRSKSFSGAVLTAPEAASPQISGKESLVLTRSPNGLVPSPPTVPLASIEDANEEDDLYPLSDDDSPTGITRILKLPGRLNVSKLIDVDSEGEEIELPAGVTKPETYIKNSGPLKIEPKVWMANERTFNRWLHVTTLMSTLTFVIYSSSMRANSPQVANTLAYIYFGLTLFCGVWGYYIFLRRRSIIMERSGAHLDNVVGPLVVAFGLIAALVVNFVLGFRHIAAANSVNAQGVSSFVSESFYANNPWHKQVHDLMFWLVRGQF